MASGLARRGRPLTITRGGIGRCKRSSTEVPRGIPSRAWESTRPTIASPRPCARRPQRSQALPSIGSPPGWFRRDARARASRLRRIWSRPPPAPRRCRPRAARRPSSHPAGHRLGVFRRRLRRRLPRDRCTSVPCTRRARRRRVSRTPTKTHASTSTSCSPSPRRRSHRLRSRPSQRLLLGRGRAGERSARRVERGDRFDRTKPPRSRVPRPMGSATVEGARAGPSP